MIPIHVVDVTMHSVSVLCLVLTVAVILFKRRVGNNFGKATLSSVLCILACYILLLVWECLYYFDNYRPTKLERKILDLIYFYFYVSLFTWLTIMTYDVWRRFWKVFPDVSDTCMFGIYCVVGWIVTFFFVLIVEFAVDISKATSFIVFYVSVAYMFLLGILLIVMVGVNICVGTKHPDALVLRGAQLVTANKEFWLNLKLFLLVGVPCFLGNFLLEYAFPDGSIMWICFIHFASSVLPSILLFGVILRDSNQHGDTPLRKQVPISDEGVGLNDPTHQPNENRAEYIM